jgi:hypothetical protein
MAGVLTGAAPVGFLSGRGCCCGSPAARREPLFPALVLLSCAPLLLSPLVDTSG